MTGDIENIIKEKDFFELTKEELKAVEEYAKTEAEYQELKWFLSSTGEAFEADKIDASPELKKKVMAHLTDSRKDRGVWMNSVGGFFFPGSKKIYQMPGAQLAAAAAIIFGIFLFTDPFNSADNKNMALNDQEQTEEEVVSAEDELAESEKQKDISNELTEDSKDLENNESRNTQEEGMSENDMISQEHSLAEDDRNRNGYADLESSAEEPEKAPADEDVVVDLVKTEENAPAEREEKSLKRNKDQSGDYFSEMDLDDATATGKEKKVNAIGGNAKPSAKKESKELTDEDEKSTFGNDRRDESGANEQAVVTGTIEETKVSSDKKKDGRKNIDKETSNIEFNAMESTEPAGDVTTKEDIKPKMISIGDTKELKALFFTVR